MVAVNFLYEVHFLFNKCLNIHKMPNLFNVPFLENNMIMKYGTVVQLHVYSFHLMLNF